MICLRPNTTGPALDITRPRRPRAHGDSRAGGAPGRAPASSFAVRRVGVRSLFAYCRHALQLSEDTAANRIHAARACLKFPVILDLLAAGELSLSAVRMLRPHLTMENHERVLGRARNARKADIQSLIAELAPRPDVPTSVRKLALPWTAGPAPSAVGGPSQPQLWRSWTPWTRSTLSAHESLDTDGRDRLAPMWRRGRAGRRIFNGGRRDPAGGAVRSPSGRPTVVARALPGPVHHRKGCPRHPATVADLAAA